MLFLTVGSQQFQFNRLIEAMDNLIESGLIKDAAFAQTGASTYVPKSFPSKAYLDRGQFGDLMHACDVVVAHGGTGAIIGAIKQGKKVIAVPRLSRFGEHVDDHQIEIVRQFADMGLIEPCYDVESLTDAYARTIDSEYKSFVSNTQVFIDDLNNYIETVISRGR